MNNQEYQQLKEKALNQFKNGEALFGKEGAFAPMLKSFLEEALQTEMEAYLNEERRARGNKRNGKKTKTIKSSDGTFVIDPPQDRRNDFEPKIIPKHETILADNLERQIIALYAMGSSYRDISTHIKGQCRNKKIRSNAVKSLENIGSNIAAEPLINLLKKLYEESESTGPVYPEVKYWATWWGYNNPLAEVCRAIGNSIKEKNIGQLLNLFTVIESIKV